MNRFAAQALDAEARKGRHVLVVTRVLDRTAFDDLAHASSPEAHVARANGVHRVDYPNGGQVVVRSYGQGMRGRAADIVYLDVDVDASFPDALDQARLIVTASPHAEIVRA